jgi:hypothetical protein
MAELPVAWIEVVRVELLGLLLDIRDISIFMDAMVGGILLAQVFLRVEWKKNMKRRPEKSES